MMDLPAAEELAEVDDDGTNAKSFDPGRDHWYGGAQERYKEQNKDRGDMEW